MATTTRRHKGVKRRNSAVADETREIVWDQLEELARQRAQEMLMAALRDERDANLVRGDGALSGLDGTPSYEPRSHGAPVADARDSGPVVYRAPGLRGVAVSA